MPIQITIVSEKVDINSYQNPAISSLQVKNIEDDSIALWCYFKESVIKVTIRIPWSWWNRFSPSRNRNKENWPGFWWKWYLYFSWKFHSKWNWYYKELYFQFSRRRVWNKLSSACTSERHLWENLSLGILWMKSRYWVSGALISDVDFSTPASDTSSFQDEVHSGKWKFPL